MATLRGRFDEILERGAKELWEDNSGLMESPRLLPTQNPVEDRDLELFFEGVETGLVRILRGGRFNTWDRPTSSGRWGLLSRARRGGWCNAEYLPQIAAYVDAGRGWWLSASGRVGGVERNAYSRTWLSTSKA